MLKAAAVRSPHPSAVRNAVGPQSEVVSDYFQTCQIRPHITVIPGDGIGPEVTAAALKVVQATGIELEVESCLAGAEAFAKGIESGVPPETIESVQRTKVLLKGPLETPIGYGKKSANVTLRKLFETYGNIRPAREIPGVQTPFTGRKLDLVIVRENLEDLYTGIEHMQTPGVALSLKVITHNGCEKIVELAFEFAVAAGRKRVHCATKANIMKLGEGMFSTPSRRSRRATPRSRRGRSSSTTARTSS